MAQEQTAAAPSASASIRTLLEQAQAGSVPALGSLLEAARHYLLLQADRHLPLALRAKVGPSDIAQETAIDAHRDFPRFRGATEEEFFAWLRTMLQHNVTDVVRRFELSQKRATCREESLSLIVDRRGACVLRAGGTQPDGSAIRREDAAVVAQVLARVPEDYQTVLRLRYWEGLTFAEIAARIGRSEEASRKLWYRALTRFTADMRRIMPPSRTMPPPRSPS